MQLRFYASGLAIREAESGQLSASCSARWLCHHVAVLVITSFGCILALPLLMDGAGSVSKETREPTDPELVAACLSGDSKSWERLLRRYERMIYSVPVRLRFEMDERQEVFQNVCCR